MKILYISEIVGKSGVFCVKKKLPQLVKEHGIDLVIANADGATGGYGLGKNHAVYLRKLGVNIITSGDQIFYKQDLYEYIHKIRYVVRPANLPNATPGSGLYYYKFSNDVELLIITLVGQAKSRRIFPDNPFNTIKRILERARSPYIFVDYHALMTSEKAAMAHFLCGKVSAMIGSGQRIQTADKRIINGTALITDLGRTGSANSVSGWVPEVEINKFMHQIPYPSQISFDTLQLQAAILDIGKEGKTEHFELLNIPVSHSPTQTTSTEDS